MVNQIKALPAIPVEYWIRNQHGLTVLANQDGHVLEVAGGLADIGNRNMYFYLYRLLTSKKNLHEIFDIPRGMQHQPLSDFLKKTSENSFFGNKAGLVTFQDEQEEYYSRIPLAYISLCELPGKLLLGSVRLASFFRKIADNFESALFFEDAEGKVAGFNRQFFLLFQDKTKSPASLLSRNVAELLLPTPSTIQQNGIEKTRSLDFGEYHLRFKAEAPEFAGKLGTANTEMGTFTTLPVRIHWSDEDVVVRFSLEKGSQLPCLIFGDPVEGYAFPDRNGYLVGPMVGGQSLLIKRQGRLLYGHRAEFSPSKDLEFSFCRIGNSFQVYQGAGRIFSFADFSAISRTRTSLILFSRPGEICRFRQIEVLTKKKDVQGLPENIFTTQKSNPSRHFLLEYLYHFTVGTPEAHFTVLKLQDMSGLKTHIENLEREFEAIAKKERVMRNLLHSLRDEHDAFVGSGTAIARIREQAEKIADSSATILIQGATGTGKEILARFIHANSGRRDGPFIKVDCATLPPQLMESLLFGHEKGAFTGADEAKPGLLAQAEGGTLFLDEAGNLSLGIQAKLLHFLQDHTILPVGGRHPIKLDLRILAASNIPLEEAVKRGTFREDLYYRIAVVVLLLPGLKQRIEDLPELANHFLQIFNKKNRKKIKGLTAAALRKLYDYSWPGNIRELKNVIERAGLFCEQEEITDDQVLLGQESTPPSEALKRDRKPHISILKTREEVLGLFRQHGNIRRLSQELGVTRKTLYNYLERQGLKAEQMRAGIRQRTAWD